MLSNLTTLSTPHYSEPTSPHGLICTSQPESPHIWLYVHSLFLGSSSTHIVTIICKCPSEFNNHTRKKLFLCLKHKNVWTYDIAIYASLQNSFGRVERSYVKPRLLHPRDYLQTPRYASNVPQFFKYCTLLIFLIFCIVAISLLML